MNLADAAVRGLYRNSRSRRTSLAQHRQVTTGVYMTRIQEVQPRDDALIERLCRSDKKPECHAHDTEEPEMPLHTPMSSTVLMVSFCIQSS